MFNPKVRFLQPVEIQSAVEELLRKFSKWKGSAVEPPIPVDAIIEQYLKIDFALADLSKVLGADDVLGATWFDEQRIRVDERLEGQEGRISFTMAHEVGHWQLHRPQYEADKLNLPLFGPASDPPPAIVCRSSQKKAPAEWQADQFAARLVMPERFVRAAFKRSLGEEAVVVAGLSQTQVQPPAQWRQAAETVIKNGNFTNVSNEAMRIRLRDLGLVTDGKQSQLVVR